MSSPQVLIYFFSDSFASFLDLLLTFSRVVLSNTENYEPKENNIVGVVVKMYANCQISMHIVNTYMYPISNP